MEESRLVRLASAQNFTLFYGNGHEKDLAQFDLAIVEPAGQTTNSLHQMQKNETLVLAYLSVMELAPESLEKHGIRPRELLEINGRPFINPEYGNYWVDLRSQTWLGLLLNKARDLLDVGGFDGLFLDTIGYVESRVIEPNLRRDLIAAAVEIVHLLRDTFPEHIIIQNCGLEELLPLTAQYIDGVCWENPPLEKEESKEWVVAVLNKLLGVQEQYGLKVLLLAEECSLDGRQRRTGAGEFRRMEILAGALNFLIYKAPKNYIGKVNVT